MKNTARWTGTWGLVLVVASAGCGEPPDDPGNEAVTIAQGALSKTSTIGTAAGGTAPPIAAVGDDLYVAASALALVRQPRRFRARRGRRDRHCDRTIVAFTARGSYAPPPRALPAGPVFWRVLRPGRHHNARSQVWELVIPARESGRPGSWGAIPDFDGDGFSDLEVTALGVGSPPPPSEVRIFPRGPRRPRRDARPDLRGRRARVRQHERTGRRFERRRVLRFWPSGPASPRRTRSALSWWAERRDCARRVPDARGDARRAGAGRQRR